MKKILLGIAVFITTAILCIVSAGAETYGDFTYTVLDDGTVKITSYTGSATELEIPSEIGGKTVTGIGDYTFVNRPSVTSITIPSTVKKLNVEMFYECTELSEIIIDSENSVYYSADGVLFDKASSKLIYYPAGKKDSEYTVPNGVTSIGFSAFDNNTNINTVAIPEGVTSIQDSAFYGCTNLTAITIPDSVSNIGVSAFEKSGVYNNSYEGVVYADGWAIDYTDSDAEHISLATSTRGIADAAFARSACTEMIIPDGVTHIGDWAFMNCKSLTSVTIPDSVKSIGDQAFSGNDSLVISCNQNTAAHKYAVDNNLSYNLLDAVKSPSAMKGFKLGGRAYNALRLNWTKNDTADGYIIEQYKSGKWVRIAKITNPATTTYRVTGLAAGTAYKFRMRAYKMDGTKALYSAYTSTLSARTNPSNITGYKLGGRAADALRLNWTKNTSADGYIIEQYKDGKWVRIKKITSNATTTYRVTGLKASTQYKFRVRAYKMSGKTALYSGYTSTLSAYTNPSKVANLKITGKAGTALRLGWSKNTSADGYIVEMYKSGKWVRVAKITSNATVTFRKSGLAKGTTYKFRVRTYNMVGKTALYGNYVNVSGTTNN